jgi:very-short-patch-repair endonuclease
MPTSCELTRPRCGLGATLRKQRSGKQLRAGQLGVWFRRQVVLLGSCIVDFFCPAAKLVVEVDGGYHQFPARQRADTRRDCRLSKAGYRVLRLPAEVVLADGAAAVAAVRGALGI